MRSRGSNSKGMNGWLDGWMDGISKAVEARIWLGETLLQLAGRGENNWKTDEKLARCSRDAAKVEKAISKSQRNCKIPCGSGGGAEWRQRHRGAGGGMAEVEGGG